MKIAIVTSRFPYPLEKGDKLRAYQQIRLLYERGHEIHLFAVSDSPVSEESLSKLNVYCKLITIHRLGRINILLNVLLSYITFSSVQSLYFFNKGFQRLIQEKISGSDFDVAYFQLCRTALYAKNILNVPLVLDYQDAFSKGMYQRANSGPFPLSVFFSLEATLLNKFERKCHEKFDAFSIISESDLFNMNLESNDGVAIIPNGVDCSYFNNVNPSEEVDVLFVGNMGYKPNIEASQFLVKEIMPIVWRTRPQVKVMLAGANPSQEVVSLSGPNVQVTGWVDDIRTCYSMAKVFVAPMISGTGLQNKILEAMSMRLATITTGLCAKSFIHGHERVLMVKDQIDDIASGIIALLDSPEGLTKIGDDSRRYVMENYNLDSIGEKLEQLFVDTIREYKK
jgi:glycosyltransferase involved in cell wall biosynthesis